MASTFLTNKVIVREALMLLSERLVGTALFGRNKEVEFKKTPKVGASVSVRRGGVGTFTEKSATSQPSVTFGDLTETEVSVTIEKQGILAVGIDDADRTLNINDFSEQILLPQVNEFAQRVNRYTLTKLKNLPTFGGVSESAPGALPASIADLAQIDKTLNDQLVPEGGRVAVVSSALNAALLSIPTLQKVNESGNIDVLRRASVGNVMNMDFAMSQGIDSSTFTSGTMTSAAVNGAVAAGATSVTYDGASGATVTLKAGDVIRIAGYGQVVVAADVTSVSSAGTITLTEQVRTAIADNAAITVYDGGGNTRQLHGAAFHPSAFEFVSIAGPPPMGGATGDSVQFGNLGMRVIFGWDSEKMQNQMTLDLYYGAACVDPRLGCQIPLNI